MHIDDMNLFVEVVRAKGFTRASEKLNIPTSTISVRINRFEQQLGVQLLNRTTRKIELTALGKLYFERAQNLVEEMQYLNHQIYDMAHTPSGILRVSLPVDFSYEVLTPLIAEFKQRYSDIQFEFDITPRKVDLVAENVDLAIRMGEQNDSSMISRLITTFQGGFYASPNYLAKYGTPKTLEELKQHQCLAKTPNQNEWRCYEGHKERTIRINGDFYSNSFGLNLRLAIEELGIAQLPHILAKQAVKNGQLVAILPTYKSQAFPCYAFTTTRLIPTKTQVFIEYLKEKLNVLNEGAEN